MPETLTEAISAEPEQLSLFNFPKQASQPANETKFDNQQLSLFADKPIPPRDTPIPPLLSAKEQEEMVNAFLMRGGANHLELIKMQYGEWPPYGLECNDSAKYVNMRIKDLLTDFPEFKDAPTTGITDKDKDGKLSVWLKEGYRNFFSTGHESVHFDQGATLELPECCQGLVVSYDLNRLGANMDRIMAETETATQTAERRELQFSKDPQGNERRYHSQETEMEAWMDDIFNTAFHEWGQFPTSKLELFAALHSANVTTPQPILDVLQNTPEGRDALERFPQVAPRTGYKAYLNINDGVSVFPEAQLTKVWEEVFPRLYASLIESYGDELGRERMGLGKSIANERILALAIEHHDEKFDFAARVEKIALENAQALLDWAEKKGVPAAADAIVEKFPGLKRKVEEGHMEKAAPISMPEEETEGESEGASVSV